MLRVNYTAAAIKVLLNGQAVAIKRGQPVKVALEKGWNRLLVKAASSEAAVPEGQNAWVSRWRFAAYLEPVLPVSYETQEHRLDDQDDRAEHVAADRRGRPDLPRLGHDRPAVPRQEDRQDPVAAVQHALRRHDRRPSARPIPADQGEDRAAGRQARRAQRRGGRGDQRGRFAGGPLLASSRRNWTRRSRPRPTPSGPSTTPSATSTARSTRRCTRTRSPPATPRRVSDGQYVYWVCGGGMKGPGSHVIACFDLDGKRVWSWHDGGRSDRPEHGNHISPEPGRRQADLRGQHDADRLRRQDGQGAVAEQPRRLAERRPRQHLAAWSSRSAMPAPSSRCGTSTAPPTAR